MPKFEVELVGKGKLTIDEEGDYVNEGGQAVVYEKNDMAIKIFHDPTDVIPLKKIKELS